MTRIAALLCAASCPVVLAACGGSTTVVTDANSAGTSTGAAATTSAASRSSTATTSTAASTTSSSAAARAGARTRCVAADLELSVLGQQGATGHGELGFALRNSSSRTCHTYGFPGVLFLSASGAALPTDARRVTQDYFGPVPAAGIELRPGQQASFRLGVTHGQLSSAGCTTASGLQVIPPDDTATLRAMIPNGAYECGTATVSPLQPGSTAFSG